MRPLEYESGRPASRPTRAIALVVLPLVAGAVTLGVAGQNFVVEPYGVFEIGDAAIQVGGPVVVLGLWIAWAALALPRRHRPRPVILVAVLGWATLNLWVAYEFLRGYFREPWNP